ncbi:hypothetical protein E1176_16950 [Fulvivirga sp. RKSG066]|nr:hypothetical protein [Fulvivirga aurantia]
MTSLATLLYVYAGIPEQVVYSLSDSVISKGAIPRETFFYVSLAFLAGMNFLLYALSRNMRYRNKSINELLRKWQLSLAVVINIFFIVITNFIFLVNSGESFNFNNFGYLIYVALALILIWILALPFLMIRAARKN